MTWTGDVARVHCDVISAQTYTQNAVAGLERMEKGGEVLEALPSLRDARYLLGEALAFLETGVSPEVLELLRGQVMPMEKVE